jgi:nucleotide-binding universal stress UspA family protein
MTNRDLIVVGVDGSIGSRRALRWAVAEARRTGSAVEAVTAWNWDGAEGAVLAATDRSQQRDHAERISAKEVDAVIAELGSSTPIAREVVEGHPVPVLVEASRTARLLVLGSHGYGRLHHAVLGSTSEEVVRQAHCPVVVIPVPHDKHATAPAEPVPLGR